MLSRSFLIRGQKIHLGLPSLPMRCSFAVGHGTSFGPARSLIRTADRPRAASQNIPALSRHKCVHPQEVVHEVLKALPCRFLLCNGSPHEFGSLRTERPGTSSRPCGRRQFLSTLNSNEKAFFNQASQVLQEIDSVSGTIAGEPGSGLGPTFNGNSCTQCHAQPAIGGSSPGLNSPQNPVANPQIALATLDGATNSLPSFVTANGPVREARFVKNPNGTPDGGVHDLYTIQGRSTPPVALSRNRTSTRR